MKHFTLESASLHSIHGTNVVNSQTLYFSILSYRPFFSAFKGPLSENGLSLEPCVPFTVYLYSFHTQLHLLHISPYTFFAQIWCARNIFSSLMMVLIGKSLDFRFYFLNNSLRPHQNNFIILSMLLKDNMNRLYNDFVV